MPRYFFHLREGDRVLPDHDGSELPNLEAARAEAIQSARELLAAKLKAGEVVDGQAFEIADESGEVVLTAPLSEALRLP
jgi:nucleoid-associated protein YgaU